MSHPAVTVCGVYSVVSFFGVLVVQLPVLAVLVLGLILLSTPGRRLPPRSLLLARTGLGVMLAECIASTAWTLLLPQLLMRAEFGSGFVHSFGYASAVAGFLLAVLFAVGVGLLVAALLSARDPAPPPAHEVPGGPGPVGPGPVDSVPPGGH
jgi:hypothetical protein